MGVDQRATVQGMSETSESQGPEAAPQPGSRPVLTREKLDERLSAGSDYAETRGRHVTVNQIVAYNMAYFRKVAGLTQEELGIRLAGWTARPWSKAAVSAAERSWDGRRTRQFDADLIFGLAEVLGVPIAAFFLPPDIDGNEERFLIDPPYFYPDHVVEERHRADFYYRACHRMYDLLVYALSDPTHDDTPTAVRYGERLGAAIDFYFTTAADVPEGLFDDLTTADELTERLSRARIQYDALRSILSDLDSMMELLGNKLVEATKDLPPKKIDATQLAESKKASDEWHRKRQEQEEKIRRLLVQGQSPNEVAEALDVPWTLVQSVRGSLLGDQDVENGDGEASPS